MDALWRQAGLDLCMSPYRCVATWHDGGMLEIVKNSANGDAGDPGVRPVASTDQ